jgi:hypothetical protein
LRAGCIPAAIVSLAWLKGEVVLSITSNNSIATIGMPNASTVAISIASHLPQPHCRKDDGEAGGANQ